MAGVLAFPPAPKEPVCVRVLISVEDGVAIFILPDAIVDVGPHAFEGIAARIMDAKNCRSIATMAFANCRNLRQIRLPKDCDIAPDAFYGCNQVQVIAPEGGSAEDYFTDSTPANFVFVPEEE